jgi:tripartite-type tricarboxylate transporter receptor subunit TctC
MLLPRFELISLFSAGLMVLGPAAVYSQDYPNKPIRIVTSGVGGGNDFVARLFAQALAVNLGQQVIVDNRGSGVAPGQAVYQAPPDGYTLLIAANNLWTGPLLYKTPYDPVRDFAPITMPTRAPYILVAHPSLPVKSVKDLIGLAKARPGELNYSSTTTGSASHIASELFAFMAGLKIVRIPYKSSAQEAVDLVSGQVQLTFFDAGTATRFMRAGTVRALAVGSAQPSPLFPALPTVAATVPGYEAKPQINGVFAPARTPEAIIRRLNQEIIRVLNAPDVKEKLLSAGVETVGTSPEQFAAEIRSEIAIFSKVIKAAGIRVE